MVLRIPGLACHQGGAALLRHLVQDAGLRQASVVIEEEGGELVLDRPRANTVTYAPSGAAA